MIMIINMIMKIMIDNNTVYIYNTHIIMIILIIIII